MKNGDFHSYVSLPEGIWKNKKNAPNHQPGLIYFATFRDPICHWSSMIKSTLDKTDADPFSIRLALAASSGSGGEVTLCRSSLTSTWKVMENAHLIPSKSSQSRKLWAKNVVNHSCQGNGTRKLKLEGFEIHPSWNILEYDRQNTQNTITTYVSFPYWDDVLSTHTHILPQKCSKPFPTEYPTGDSPDSLRGTCYIHLQNYDCLPNIHNFLAWHPCPAQVTLCHGPKLLYNRFWTINQD